MKSARLAVWPNQYKQPGDKKPDFTGTISLPAALVWELYQLLMSGTGFTVDQQTGEQIFQLKLSCWRGTGQPGTTGNAAPVLSGQITTPSEAAELAARQAAGPQGGYPQGGYPPAAQYPPPPAQPPYGQAPVQPYQQQAPQQPQPQQPAYAPQQPAPQQWGAPPPQQPAPAPVAPPQPGGWSTTPGI
jgi:hypothetical protein